MSHALTKQLSNAEVRTKITIAVDESFSKQQIPSTPSRSASSRPILTCTLVGIAEDEDAWCACPLSQRPPTGTEVRRVSEAECETLRCGELRAYFPFFSLINTSCLTMRSARMAYRSTLDPTATWLGYPYEVRLPPQRKSCNMMRTTFGLDKVKRRLTE